MSKKIVLTEEQFNALVNGKQPQEKHAKKQQPQPQGGGLDGLTALLLFIAAVLVALVLIPGGGQ